MKYLILLLGALWYITCKTEAQAADKCSVKLYHCISLTATEKQAMIKNNISSSVLLDGRYIYPKGTNEFDSIGFKSAIASFFPGLSDTGLAIIDIENKDFEDLLFAPASSASLQAAINKFVTVLNVAKRTRPKVTWGIYSLPYYSYWKRNELWKNQAAILEPLLKNVDVLMLSLYDFYKDGMADDKAYITENTSMALKAAKLLKKPLYVFVWQRYHDSEAYGLELIPAKEFTTHIDNILQVKQNGIGVSGIVWFDSPQWFYQQKPQISISDVKTLGLSAKKTSKEKARHTIIEKYGQILLQRSKAACLKR